MRFGSLFAGIGGIDLGLERAGMECVWQVETDDYCNRVLEKHWPTIRRHGDIRELHGHGPSRGEGWHSCNGCLYPVDLIAGGFPCQPHSVAGKRRGAEDDRNLWPEFRRVIAELRPRYVIAENVPGIITTYLDTVLSDLESEGYACAPLNLPAVAFDAPHRRERIFIVGHASQFRRYEASDERSKKYRRPEGATGGPSCTVGIGTMADTGGRRYEPSPRRIQTGRNGTEHESWWTIEPNVDRVASGIPNRVDRLRGLGNAVVPQVAEWIGRRILEHDNMGNPMQ